MTRPAADDLSQEIADALRPARGTGWISYGRNLYRRGYQLRLYLTNNPEIDRFIREGYAQAEARAREAAQPTAKPSGKPIGNPRGKPGAKRAPDLFSRKPG